MEKAEAMNWNDPSIYLKEIFVERSCLDHDVTNSIIARAGLPFSVVDAEDFPSLVKGIYPENLGKGKRSLLLCRNRSEFLKKCPATREYRCCDYQVINVGTGCPMDCVYCILQAYLNNPYLTYFINTEDLFSELEEKVDSSGSGIMRIGTGEFTDSMALDRITCLSTDLVEFFAQRKNAVLELKTKSGYVDNLEGLQHKGRTIVAWSLNSQEIVENQEIRAARLDQRLAAAAKCASWGYHLAFHFDPIISYPGWQQGYRNSIRKLFETVPASAIRWISLGGFRYLPKLKQIGTKRFPHSEIYYHEFIEGLDGKQRYFRPHRVQLYKEIYRELSRFADPATCIYFCMESDEIWQEVMGFVPEDHGGLPTMLDRSMAM
jgi:spore photoproduct lyase